MIFEWVKSIDQLESDAWKFLIGKDSILKSFEFFRCIEKCKKCY